MNNESHTTLWHHFENAATTAIKQNALLKAARILKQAFREAEEFGEIDESLVSLAYSLAELHLNNYRYAEAESLVRAVLEVREKLLGQTHPDVVDSLKKVAIVQIMAFRAEALGKQSPPTGIKWSDSKSIYAS